MTFGYGRKQPPPDKLCATAIASIVVVCCVTSVQSAAITVGADDAAAVLVVSRVSITIICVCRVGLPIDTPSPVRGASVVTVSRYIDVIRQLANAAGSIEALPVKVWFRW